ncbi:MAG: class I SAM-dependent methyltransferase [archaeon]
MKPSSYYTFPELSPYIRTDRYEEPKSLFVHTFEKMSKHIDIKNGQGTLADLGCANGEFLYYLKKQLGSGWQMKGIDSEQKFIEVASSFPGLKNIEFKTGDMFEVEGPIDVVTCIGTMQIFVDIEVALGKIINIVAEGGWLFLTGLFNPYDVDVVYQFRDHSKPQVASQWRCDFNIHFQTRISNYLQGKCKYFDFVQIKMDIDIPRKPDSPHMHQWTETLSNGEKLTTHGGRLITDKWLVTINK